VTPGNADEIDNIVKNAILATQPKVKSATQDCQCPNCDCDNCQCKPGFKCDDNGCQRLKGKEPSVETCWVVIDDRKAFTIKNMSPDVAIAAIKAQGQKVVFVDAGGRVTTPPAWFPAQTFASGPQTFASGPQSATPFTMPATTVPTPSAGWNSAWSSGNYRMAPTPIAAPSVGLYGGIAVRGSG